MEDKFYDDSGRIKNPEAAHDIANLEKPAKDRELELRRQAETNLTKEERENLAIMAKYSEKYPDAFEKQMVDSLGREVLVVDTGVFSGKARGGLDGALYFTQEGFFQLASSQYGNFALVELPADEAVELARKAEYGKLNAEIDFEVKNSFGTHLDVRAWAMKLDVIGNEATRGQIREVMVARQQVGEERNKKRQTVEEARMIENVLSDL